MFVDSRLREPPLALKGATPLLPVQQRFLRATLRIPQSNKPRVTSCTPPFLRAGIILWLRANKCEFARNENCATISVLTMRWVSLRIALPVCLGLFLATLAPVAMGQEIESVYGPLPVFEFHSSFWVNLHHFLYHEARVRQAAKDAQASAGKSSGPVMKGSPSAQATLTAAEQKVWDEAIA